MVHVCQHSCRRLQGRACGSRHALRPTSCASVAPSAPIFAASTSSDRSVLLPHSAYCQADGAGWSSGVRGGGGGGPGGGASGVRRPCMRRAQPRQAARARGKLHRQPPC
jgi:hypothetical protein